mmetsp:Transcript_41/g.95  ORF Transcript_41/g.95 Transcript_41/m.95 type:complete len:127 (-) Transcript_41:350-730(-)
MKTFLMITLVSTIVMTMMPTISSAKRMRKMYACSMDDCVYGEAYEYYWDELCDEQLAAAEVLGYNQETWDCDADCVDELDQVLTHLSWESLPPTLQEAYGALCFTEESWNENMLQRVKEAEEDGTR